MLRTFLPVTLEIVLTNPFCYHSKAVLSPKITLSKYPYASTYPITKPKTIEILGPIIKENMIKIAGG